MHTQKLLCLGREEILLDTRARILSRRYAATSAHGLRELQSLADREEYDLILFCHSLSDDECQALAAFARKRWPMAKLLSISGRGTPSASCASDAQVAALDGPVALLRAVDALLQQGSPATL